MPLPDLIPEQLFDPQQIQATTPQLFVGLGGTGGLIVQRIFDRMNSNPHWRQYESKAVGFLVLDTNVRDLDRFEENGKINKVCIKKSSQYDDLVRLINAQDPHLLQWMQKGYRPRQSDEGAGQIRLESRVAHYVNSLEIANQLDRIIAGLIDDSNQFVDTDRQKIQIYVFATLAGGTGSGCFLPMTYLMKERCRNRGLTTAVDGYLLTSQTVKGHQAVKPELFNKIDANTYAALKELELFNGLGTKDANHAVKPFAFPYRRPNTASDPIPRVSEPPFEWITLIDQPKTREIRQENIWKAVADMAYMNIASPSEDSEKGALDNYTVYKLKRSFPHFSPGLQVAKGFSNYWGTAGAAALICPRQELLGYCQKRFTAEVLRNQFSLIANETEKESLPVHEIKDREERLKVINSLWKENFTKMATDEMKTVEASIAKWMAKDLDAIRADPSIAVKAAHGNLKYAAIYKTVHGRHPSLKEDVEGLSGKPKKSKKSFGQKQSDDDSSKANKPVKVEATPLVETVKALLDARCPTISLINPRKLNVGDKDIEQGQLLSRWHAASTEANSKWAELEPRLRKLAHSASDLLSEARKAAGDSPYGAIGERYLVLELLNTHAGRWLQTAKDDRDKYANKTILNAKHWEETVKEVHKRAEEIQIDEPLEYIKEWTGKSNYKKDIQGIAQERMEAGLAIIISTNKWAQKEFEVQQLEAFHAFLTKRAATFAEIQDLADRRSVELEQEANELLSRPDVLEPDKAFQQRVEVLRDIGTNKRHWDGFWNCRGPKAVAALLDDHEGLGAEVDKAFTSGERKASSEGQPLSVQAILHASEEAFQQRSFEAVCALIRKETSIDRLLVLEAIFGTHDPESPALTAITVNEIETALGDPTHNDHATIKQRLNHYVTSKLKVLKERAVLMASYSAEKVDNTANPPAALTSLVATKDVLANLEARFDTSLKVLHKFKDLSEEKTKGRYAWTDPRTLMVYHCVKAAPIYAFDDIERNLHGAYINLQDPARKPNPLHIDNRWENADALDNLTVASRMGDQIKSWRTENRAFLIELMRAGVLRVNHSKWSMEGDGYAWPDDGSDVEVDDEYTANQWFERLMAKLTAQLRPVLKDDIAARGTKVRFGGQAATALEQIARLGRTSGWTDQSIVKEFETLAAQLRKKL